MNERRLIDSYDDGRADALAEVDDLRELVREAHGAMKDLERLLRQVREAARDGANQAREAAEEAAIAVMKEFERHIQREADIMAHDLNRAVQAARNQIIDQLTVDYAEPMPGGGTRVKFKGNLFDDGGVQP